MGTHGRRRRNTNTALLLVSVDDNGIWPRNGVDTQLSSHTNDTRQGQTEHGRKVNSREEHKLDVMDEVIRESRRLNIQEDKMRNEKEEADKIEKEKLELQKEEAPELAKQKKEHRIK